MWEEGRRVGGRIWTFFIKDQSFCPLNLSRPNRICGVPAGVTFYLMMKLGIS